MNNRTQHTPLNAVDCVRLARQGFAESIRQILYRNRADGAIAYTSDHAEVVILDDSRLSRHEMVVQVLAAGLELDVQPGTVLRILVTGKSVRILEIIYPEDNESQRVPA